MSQLTARTRFVLIAALALAPCLMAQAVTEQEFQGRFKQRFADLLKYKAAGKIGETDSGYVEAVDAKYAKDAGVGSIITGENADRKLLYELLAKKNNTAADQVAKRNALRNLENVRPGEHYRKDGKWLKK